jgi:hypothetical protein
LFLNRYGNVARQFFAKKVEFKLLLGLILLALFIRFKKTNHLVTLILKMLISVIIMSCNNNCLAFHAELEPSLNWEVCYEDNVESVTEEAGGKKSDFSNRFEPALKFKIDFSRCSINGLASGQLYRYIHEKDWNNDDQNHFIKSDFNITQNSKLRIGSSYRVDTNPERYFDPESDFQTGVLVRRQRTTIKTYHAGLIHDLSAKSTLDFQFNFVKFFSEVSSGSDVYSYGLLYNYELDQNDSIKLRINYSDLKFNYTFGDGTFDYELKTYNISGGVKHQFSETFTVDFSAGWYYTEVKSNDAIFEIDPVTGEPVLVGFKRTTNSSSGTNFSLSVEKKFYRTTVQLTGSQDVNTTPDTGQTYQSRIVRFTISHDLTHKLSGSIFWSFYQNEADAGEFNNIAKVDDQAYNSGVRLTYRYNRNIYIALRYANIISENNTFSADTETKRNTISLLFRFTCLRPFIVS